MTKNGWKLSIFIERARMIQVCDEDGPKGPTLDRDDLRKLIFSSNRVYFCDEPGSPSDELESFENVWFVRPVEGRHKQRPIARFIAPNFDYVSQIKAARVEINKAAKAANAERSQLARASKKLSTATRKEATGQSLVEQRPAQEGVRARASGRL